MKPRWKRTWVGYRWNGYLVGEWDRGCVLYHPGKKIWDTQHATVREAKDKAEAHCASGANSWARMRAKKLLPFFERERLAKEKAARRRKTVARLRRKAK